MTWFRATIRKNDSPRNICGTAPKLAVDEVCDPAEEKKVSVLVKGLPAGPGAAVGQLVFTAEDAVAWERKGKTVILIRDEKQGFQAAKELIGSPVFRQFYCCAGNVSIKLF